MHEEMSKIFESNAELVTKGRQVFNEQFWNRCKGSHANAKSAALFARERTQFQGGNLSCALVLLQSSTSQSILEVLWFPSGRPTNTRACRANAGIRCRCNYLQDCRGGQAIKIPQRKLDVFTT
mmetsp:Transcript_17401/g.48082  ORF Transcript_17401/g.48082 Transcript_17401/m.48082 type:complete len:123 (+) Transcript_17401:1294-1662(+)